MNAVIRILCLMLLPMLAMASEAATLKGLLEEVRQFDAKDRAVNQQREQQFDGDLQQQQALLEKSKQRLQSAESEQERLKNEFDANDIRLAEMDALIRQRSGQLGEVFGVSKEKAGELSSLLEDSLTSADNPDRSEPLAFAQTKRVPTLQDLEALWYQLQLEMTASGEIKRFEAPVIEASGDTQTLPVVRFGLFAAASESGRYLNWDVDRQHLTELPTQPQNAELELQAYFKGASDEVSVDPTRGQLFMLLDRQPKLEERVHQGGEVGYLILALGALGLLVALVQVLSMINSELKIRRQLKRPDQLKPNNALGRVLQTVSDQPLDPQQRELKVDEAILQELPSLERGQSFLKLLAAVAPLLGLLGTVVGMISTFQSITLFGTSDPKLMAGGISQALITTVLGLIVAIPLLFSHSYLAARSRRLTQILQQKSLGLLAQHADGDDSPEALDRVA